MPAKKLNHIDRKLDVEAKRIGDVFRAERAKFVGEGIRKCEVCGCMDELACEAGCSWVKADDYGLKSLCSSCRKILTHIGLYANEAYRFHPTKLLKAISWARRHPRPSNTLERPQ